jgi:hypothetical protein
VIKGEVEWEAKGASKILGAGQSAFSQNGDPPSAVVCLPSGDVDTRRSGDEGNRVGAQAGLAERRHPQVGSTDQVVDGAAHGCLDARAGRQAGEQDCDAEGNAQGTQDRAQRSRPEARSRLRASSG